MIITTDRLNENIFLDHFSFDILCKARLVTRSQYCKICTPGCLIHTVGLDVIVNLNLNTNPLGAFPKPKTMACFLNQHK